jgi:hypothetical protein
MQVLKLPVQLIRGLSTATLRKHHLGALEGTPPEGRHTPGSPGKIESQFTERSGREPKSGQLRCINDLILLLWHYFWCGFTAGASVQASSKVTPLTQVVATVVAWLHQLSRGHKYVVQRKSTDSTEVFSCQTVQH